MYGQWLLERLARTAAAVLLAGGLALVAPPGPPDQRSPAPASPGAAVVTAAWSGTMRAALAQERIDVGILELSFKELPLSVEPGQRFDLLVNAAAGSICSGSIVFRQDERVSLDEIAVDGGSCGWSVTVPSTARPGSAQIVVDAVRGGQAWRLFGVVYVNPVGESR